MRVCQSLRACMSESTFVLGFTKEKKSYLDDAPEDIPCKHA